MASTRGSFICALGALMVALVATILAPQPSAGCLLGMNRELARGQLMSLLGQYPDLLNGQQGLGGMYGQGQGLYGNQRLPNGLNGLNGQQQGLNGLNGQQGFNGQQGLNGLNGQQQGLNGMGGLGQQGGYLG